jgi:hypothetical protein
MGNRGEKMTEREGGKDGIGKDRKEEEKVGSQTLTRLLLLWTAGYRFCSRSSKK